MHTDEQTARFLRYLAGEATADEVRTLNGLLGGDASARAHFLQVASHAQAQHERCARMKRLVRPVLVVAAAALVLACAVWWPQPAAEERHVAAEFPAFRSESVLWDDVCAPLLDDPGFVWPAGPGAADASLLLPGDLSDMTDSPTCCEPDFDRISLFADKRRTDTAFELLSLLES